MENGQKFNLLLPFSLSVSVCLVIATVGMTWRLSRRSADDQVRIDSQDAKAACLIGGGDWIIGEVVGNDGSCVKKDK